MMWYDKMEAPFPASPDAPFEGAEESGGGEWGDDDSELEDDPIIPATSIDWGQDYDPDDDEVSPDEVDRDEWGV